MSVKALQDYTYYSKYARYNKEEGRRETWAEAVDRVKQMHLRRYPQVADDIEWAFEMVKQKKVLGSQRALQFGGEPCEKKNARMYNCTSSFCDRVRFFQEAFWLLLCGSGTGFSVQKHHVDKLPNFHKLDRTTLESKTFSIPDTIEGWADALGILLATYLPHSEFSDWKGLKVDFDYSLIRAEGASLASGVGKAPGPEPLKRSLEIIRKLLDRCLDNKQKKLKSVDAYDIIMHASDAVLSGGVRRSATIALFSHDDEEMATAKTGNWFVDNPQRARSNNSAVLIRDEVSKEDFLKLMESIKQFGEPGFYWSDSTEQVPNPCVVADSTVLTDRGLEMVSDLIDKGFNAVVDGVSYPSQRGFWKTGTKQVIELQFKSGRTLKVTPNHKIMTTTGWKEAGDISFGEDIVINNHRSNLFNSMDNDSEDCKKGYLLGLFLGDGNNSKSAAQLKWWGESKEQYRRDAYKMLSDVGFINNHHQAEQNSVAIYSSIESKKLMQFAVEKDCMIGASKKISKKTICGSSNYISGLIAGYFDADGTVLVNNIKGSSLRISSVQIENLQNLQIALNSLGIYSKIYKNRRTEGERAMPDGNGGTKNYFCQTSHELVISNDNIVRFSQYVPIKNGNKLEKLQTIVGNYKRMPNRTNFTDRLINKVVVGELDVYDCTVEDIHAFDNDTVYVHNCVEVGFYPVDVETGESGWQCCNLTEINGKKIKCKEDFAIAARAASIIGTLQAGYTSFPYLGRTTEKIVEREALLGVSITGMMDNPDVIFDPEIQKEMAKLVLDTNEWMAKKIGINPCARSTCIKPAGTTSCLLGTSSGIHPHHAKRYFRRTQANQMEPVLQYFKKFNPHAAEKSVWSANKKDEVVTFCVEVPNAAKTKNDLSAQDLLEYVKTTQQNWVAYGKRKSACTQPWLSHNVSNTINVRPDEWEIVGDFIYKNRKYFAGVSLLPASGDLDYPQAPFCNVLNAKEILQEYGEGCMLASGLIVDGLHAYGDLWEACNYAVGLYILEKPAQPEDEKTWELKNDWIRRVRQFAMRYCDGNIKKCTYMLKHVNNWKIWLDLTKEYKEVDYTQFLEDKDYTKPMDTIACAGGKCELN